MKKNRKKFDPDYVGTTLIILGIIVLLMFSEWFIDSLGFFAIGIGIYIIFKKQGSTFLSKIG